MAFAIDEKGNITLVQGDNGTIVIDGFKTDKNYTIYFAIQDKDRKPIGEELCVQTNQNSSVIFELTGEYTSLLAVPQKERAAIYYYGIKQCSNDGLADTLLIGGSDIGCFNTILVYPKKVEGQSA